jgi:hypothetical protein
VRFFATTPFDERKRCFARCLGDLDAQRVDVRSFQTVTDGLAELRAAYLQNLDIDEDDEIDDELKAKLESTNVTALMKMARARPTKCTAGHL